jgi:rSAM/selenodomain-associated transferase 2
VVFTVPVLHVECQTGIFQEIHWLKLFEYVPFYGLLLWEGFRSFPSPTSQFFESVSGISVIIPSLNESHNIGRCLESVKNHASIEMVVADGGSTDGTPEIARSLGARVVEGKKGRGTQIGAGIRACRGDVILILHADCVLDPDVLHHVLMRLNGEARYIGGSVGMVYHKASFKNQLVTWLNNTRARLTGISFGDQAQFFRREALELMGGYPELMLMEDVELAMRLKEHGPVCFIPRGVVASDRRWRKLGFWGTFGRVVFHCTRYLVQRRLGIQDETGKDDYDCYYRQAGTRT